MLINHLGGESRVSPERSDPSRVARLGYSLCAMLDEAKKNGLYQEEENFPTIPELLSYYEKASQYFLQIIQSQESRLFETLMYYSCRYLFGKAVEGTLLWAKSPDGNISINFEAGDMAKGIIVTDLPKELENLIVQSMEDAELYFKAHQTAMITYQSQMAPDHIGKEIAVTLEYFPRIGIAYAIGKGYHEMYW